MATVVQKKNRKPADNIPAIHDATNMLLYVYKSDINSRHLNTLKTLTNLNDDIVAGKLNINARTLRNYRKGNVSLKGNTKEQVVLLLSLFTHGIEVFGTKENFDAWLDAKNVMLGLKRPLDFMDTVSGIRFIDDRLTAIEYGDNV